MRILSLFDGMACGHIAMQLANVPIEKYVAYEIDKYAIQTAQHNFPEIEECGDVFKADFTQYKGFDFLVGGSPCTYWSIAQTKNRETTASGLGWELFSQYVRALREAEPKYFIYENNKSMSSAIRASICETFGFDAICINSALVSAQNRQRLYWVGIRQEDGLYKKADIKQPEDRGILLKDVLDGATIWLDKAHTIDANYFKGGNMSSPKKQSGTRAMAAESVKTLSESEMDYMVRDHQDQRWSFLNKPGEEDKSHCLVANLCKGVPYNICAERIPDYGIEDKSRPLSASYKNKGCGDGSLNTEAFPDNPNKQVFDFIAEPIGCEQVGAMPRPNGDLSTSQGFRIYSTDGKSVTLRGNAGGAGGKTGLYAISVDGKETSVYEVKDGQITIKGKQYPIKLKDGYYIIRKLTVTECMRLQTVPAWYSFSVSNSQAYKMLGNGWTCEVIAHLIRGALSEETAEEQLSFGNIL